MAKDTGKNKWIHEHTLKLQMLSLALSHNFTNPQEYLN